MFAYLHSKHPPHTSPHAKKISPRQILQETAAFPSMSGTSYRLQALAFPFPSPKMKVGQDSMIYVIPHSLSQIQECKLAILWAAEAEACTIIYQYTY